MLTKGVGVEQWRSLPAACDIAEDLASKAVRRRVLVADDDAIIRQLAGSKLGSLGYEAIEAVDGRQARELLERHTVSLAIVDLGMPNVDGFELIDYIRGAPRTRHLPVIVVTSRTDSTAIVAAFEAGATSFLTKPVHWATFGNHVEYLMRLEQSAHMQRNRAQRAEAASRVKDAAIAAAFSKGLDRSARIAERAERMLEELRDCPEGEYLHDQLVQILAEAADVVSSLRHARNVSRHIGTTTVIDEKLVPLRALLAAAQTDVQKLAASLEVTVSVGRQPDDALVACDPEGMVAAFTQVIGNAVSFSRVGGRVTVEANLHLDSLLTIEVSDDGPGMSPDVYAACLNPLGHEDLLPEEIDSTQCAGLVFVKAVTEAHGGELEIRSMPGQGTTVMIALPAERVLHETDIAA
jgi:CheY-like chemotaxis protein